MLVLPLALLVADCGGGGGGDGTVATTAGGDAGAAAGGPPVSSPATPTTTTTPSSPSSPTTPTTPATPPAGSGATPPAGPAVQQATWTVVFSDATGQAGPRSLNRNGQLAFTGLTALGPRARYFDGTTVHELDGGAASAVSVNEAGQVVGHFEAGDFTRAFRWQAGTQQPPLVLDTSPDVSSDAVSINTAGVAAGTESSRRNLPGSAIRWAGGGLAQALAPLEPSPPGSSQGRFINTAGAVAGVALGIAGNHAAFWGPGSAVVLDVGTLGGTESQPAALNDAGQVAGQATTADGRERAFLWSEASGILDLGTLGGPTSSANAMNAAGSVVGTADAADGSTAAFLWRDGAMRALGTLGGRTSAASAINASGLVGGNAATATGVPHAFVWTEATGMVDLNDRLTGTSPGVLQSVLAVSDDGSVLAMADGGTLVLLRPTASP
ncbi:MULTISPECIES: hypothetical protein [Ramlibacter]|nr:MULTISPECIES: hypothetical protein [Ramlibacter]MBA2964375.1 hypothetical protein [Ramlibacter sp. CGMCC 1.13660]